MAYEVVITEEAGEDIEEVFRYLLNRESPNRAKFIVDGLLSKILSLRDHPLRGHVPVEKDEQQERTYRELNYKGFRIIYEIVDATVMVAVVAHHTRDMVSLLERRRR